MTSSPPQHGPLYRLAHDVALAVSLSAAGIGMVAYLASFFDYSIESAFPMLSGCYIAIVLTQIPAAVRDYRFFKTHWGIGLLDWRRKFPLQFFSARNVEWLNPLAFIFMGILFLHFFGIVISSSTNSTTATNSSAELRFVAMMVIAGGTLCALSWHYPPTEKPQTSEPQP